MHGINPRTGKRNYFATFETASEKESRDKSGLFLAHNIIKMIYEW